MLLNILSARRRLWGFRCVRVLFGVPSSRRLAADPIAIGSHPLRDRPVTSTPCHGVYPFAKIALHISSMGQI